MKFLPPLVALAALAVGCSSPDPVRVSLEAEHPYLTADRGAERAAVADLTLEPIGELSSAHLRDSLRRLVGEAVTPAGLEAYLADRRRHAGTPIELSVAVWRVDSDELPPFMALRAAGGALACVVPERELRRVSVAAEAVTVFGGRVTLADDSPGQLDAATQHARIAGYDVTLDDQGRRLADPQVETFEVGARFSFLPALTQPEGSRRHRLLLAMQHELSNLVEYQRLTVDDGESVIRCSVELPVVSHRRLDWERFVLRPGEGLLLLQPWLTGTGEPRLQATAVTWRTPPRS